MSKATARESSPTPVLDREFLEIRARILQLAADLDRLQRGGEPPAGDPRAERIRAGLQVLLDGQPDRAARVQLAFSRPYDPGWRTEFQI